MTESLLRITFSQKDKAAINAFVKALSRYWKNELGKKRPDGCENGGFEFEISDPNKFALFLQLMTHALGNQPNILITDGNGNPFQQPQTRKI